MSAPRRSTVAASTYLVAIAAFICAFTTGLGVAAADTVLLMNGDRLTGTFVDVSRGKLDLQTAIGRLAIPVGQLATVTVETPVVIVVRQGPALRGTLTITPSHGWTITDDQGRTATPTAAAIVAILPAARYDALLSHRAPPWRDWNGSVTVGYDLQRGNQQTNNFSGALDAQRERSSSLVFRRHWRTNAHVNVLLAGAAAGETSIAANTFTAGARQDLLLGPGDFVFGIAQFDHVGTEGLSLRETYGGGAGYDLKRNGRGTFSLFGGLTLVRETFLTGERPQTVQLLVGEKYQSQVTPRLHIDHTLTLYPNLSFVGRYHFDTHTSLDVKLTDRFALNVGLVDLYLTNPASGSERNNFALTTGFSTTF